MGKFIAGILIASLGAVMDVAMSISSTIEEISYQNPELGIKGLFFSGMRVGKDMMGTMSNTLFLPLQAVRLIHWYLSMLIIMNICR